jgi:hypothetical protein
VNKLNHPGRLTNMEDLVLVVSGRVVHNNAKIDWPDLNYPGSGETILRYLHNIDYVNMKLQLDGEDGPWFTSGKLPDGVAFYQKVT